MLNPGPEFRTQPEHGLIFIVAFPRHQVLEYRVADCDMVLRRRRLRPKDREMHTTRCGRTRGNEADPGPLLQQSAFS